MPPASTEADRLAALSSYRVLDTASEEAFDDLVALAARLTNSPIALVSLIDADRQWFKARYGLDATETHRDEAFCAHAILNPEHPLIVEDTTADPRFHTNPLVTGEPNIRSYLGVPLVNPEGYALGTLCIIDRVSRSYEPATVDIMRTLARAVTVNLELRRALLREHEVALTDLLTGLPNRRAVMEALAAMAKRSEPVAVIAVDLDHFKEVNDGEGHAAGDALLQETADRLRQALRPGDLAGRLGGDEFVVLLSGVRDREVVIGIAQRISALLHRPVEYRGKRLRLGATLGVAIVPDDVSGPETAMRVADEALVRAKRDRRGSVACASRDDTTQLLSATAIVRAFDADAAATKPLQGAIAHFQPILALGPTAKGASALVALEVLARWHHPAVGEISPGELFTVIGPERAAELGQVVRHQALTTFVSLRQNGLADVRLALNLSPSEVFRADIADHIAEQVERAGLSLRDIDVEITEEVLLDRVSDRTLDQLAALRGRGARLILDDFGTGNSGLAQLLRLPLDGVKLDKQFIQKLGVDTRADGIVQATISLCHGLGLEVVAEGVETEPQATMLRSFKCDAVQGFLYARAMSSDELKVWLHATNVAVRNGDAAACGRGQRSGQLREILTE